VIKTLSINPQKTWALLIGVGEFTDPKKLPPIPAVTNNLAKLRELLANPAIVGIPPERIIVIGDKEVPKDNSDILSQVDKLPPIVETLFVYYVGHGIPYNGIDRSCEKLLYLAHSRTPHDKSTMALPFVDLWNETINRATNLIYILDCCLSGKALSTVTKKVGRNISVLTATLPTENAKAPNNEEHSSFTKHLIELLEKGFGEAPTLTTTEIRKELGRRLPIKGSPKPWGEDFLDSEEPLRIAHNRSFPKKTIFLAEVTDDLKNYRNEVKNFLEQQQERREDIEIRILPMQDYDVSSEKLTEYLKQSDLFVQLLSDHPEKDLVKIQYDCAKAAEKTILQWRSPELTLTKVLAKVQDEAHRQLLRGITVKAMDIEEFKSEILKQLYPPQSQTAPKLTAGALVMVNTTPEDTELLDEITDFLDERKISYTPTMKPSGQISTKVGSRGLKEHHLTCNYHFRVRAPNFTSEDVALNWVLLSYPTTLP